jgi:hypothetical protein
MADETYSPEQKQQMLNLQDQIKSWQAILTSSSSTPEQKAEALNDVKAAKKAYSVASAGRKAYQSISKASDAAEAAEDTSDTSEVVEGLAEAGEVLEDLAPLLLL